MLGFAALGQLALGTLPQESTVIALQVDAGAIVLNGYPAVLAQGRGSFEVAAQAVTLSGQSVNLRHGHALHPEAGEVTVDAKPVDFTYVRAIKASVGHVSVSKKAVDLDKGSVVAPAARAIRVTGRAVNLRQAHKIVPSRQAIAITGKGVDLKYGYAIRASRKHVKLTGKTVEWGWIHNMAVLPGAIIVDGNPGEGTVLSYRRRHTKATPYTFSGISPQALGTGPFRGVPLTYGTITRRPIGGD